MTTTPTSGAADLPEALIHAGMQALLQCTASELENLSPTLFEGYAGDVQRVFVAMTGKALSAALAAGQAPAAPAQPAAPQGAADGFFLLLPQRPKPEAPAGTAGLDWDAYSGAQMLVFGRDCSDAAIAALRTEQPAPATQQAGERVYAFRRKGLDDFCTCDEARYEELSNKPHLFETRIFYTTPQPTPTAQSADSVQEDAARLDFLIEQRAYVVSDPDACPGHWLHWAMPDGRTWVQDDEHQTPRAAIDAARKQGEK